MELGSGERGYVSGCSRWATALSRATSPVFAKRFKKPRNLPSNGKDPVQKSSRADLDAPISIVSPPELRIHGTTGRIQLPRHSARTPWIAIPSPISHHQTSCQKQVNSYFPCPSGRVNVTACSEV